MNNNDIKVEEIKAGNTPNETISVEIKDEAGLLIEAHNSSSLSHKNIFDSMKEKMDGLFSSVNELKENVPKKSDMPKKVSDLQNDLGFMNEENLSNAVRIMGLINGETFQNEVNNIKNEVQNNLQMSSNTIFNEINGVEAKIPDYKTIVNISTRSEKLIFLTPPANEGTITVPENGILYWEGVSANYGWFSAIDASNDIARFRMNHIYPEQTLGNEFQVKKGDIIKFMYGEFRFDFLIFFYMNGNKPQGESEEV